VLRRARASSAIQLAAGMIDSGRWRSLLLVVVLWAIAFIGAGFVFPRRPTPTIGVQVLASAAALALMFRLQGRRVFLRETVPCLVYFAAIFAVPRGPGDLYRFMAAILLAVVWAVLVRFIGHN
jgi:hypothetical protein